jgi:hypothetical protein
MDRRRCGGRGDAAVQRALVKTGPGAETLLSRDLNVLADDVNKDGNPDLVATTRGALNVLFGNGDGSFRRQTFRVREPVDVAVGDVSGDGQPDLIAVRSTTMMTASSSCSSTTERGAFAATASTR